uniref:Uncharacterized protein n=1 Tax=Monopterus albus TaxID=43700 RepID=A0A3Q3IZZ4_MONAL
MENKVQEVTQQLTEKDILLEVLQKEKEQAAVVVKELETALQSRRELISHAKIYRDQLKSLSHSNEQLEQSKRQLEEEVRDLRYRMEKEQYRCDAEERAYKNIQRKLEHVNILQQSQEANDANARFLLEHKIFEMERKLGERQLRKTLEAETESTRTHLVEAIKEAERCLAAHKVTEKALHSEKVKHQHFIDKLTDEATSQRETISSLSQKLAAAGTRANSMENKVHQVTQQLTEKGLLLEVLQKEKEQAAVRVKELETALQSKRELISHAKICDQLKSLSHSKDQLEQSKRQLEEEVRVLRYCIESMQQYRCDAEERAYKNIQQKLEQVNILQQSQERKLGEARTTQQDILNQRDSTHTELERYRQLYTDEMHLRKSLAVKLERTESQLSKANFILVCEHNRSLITSSTANSSRVEDHLEHCASDNIEMEGVSDHCKSTKTCQEAHDHSG